MATLPRDTENNKGRVVFAPFSLKRRHFEDKMAAALFALGGVAVILAIIAILFFITLETIPLWAGAKAKLEGVVDLTSDAEASASPARVEDGASGVLAVGVDEYRDMMFLLAADGRVVFYSIPEGRFVKSVTLEKARGDRLVSASLPVGKNLYAASSSQGYVYPVEIGFEYSYGDGSKRLATPRVVENDPIKVADSPIKTAYYAKSGDGSRSALAAITEDGKLLLVTERVKTSLFGESEKRVERFELSEGLDFQKPVRVAIDGGLDNLFVGTDGGRILRWSIRGDGSPTFMGSFEVNPGKGDPVTALGFILGGNSLAVGTESGSVSVWFMAQDPTSPEGRSFKKVHELASHPYPVTAMAPSLRNRGLLTADARGNIILHYVTSERKLLELSVSSHAVEQIAFAPKANGIVALDGSGKLYDLSLHNPHPEVSFKALFGKIWYEGYEKPEYVWQSTGGTDDFEPKFSLTPLAYGTIKGTFYALLFAIPLAILSAVCVAQFVHPSIRNVVKPTLEIMAGLPSVVLGFLAGLWMAPLVEKYVPGIMAGFVVMPLLILVAVFLWRLLFPRLKGRVKLKDGMELFLLIPVIIFGFYICYLINGLVESSLFGGDYRTWLFDSLGITYDQRNALVVGFAMGFAVIPIIFTISEDSLSNVPGHLVSGSLALGATRWQTALHVVLPTASPGIFSAIMIGLGRAVGETMIVLMATGNTPIMDWSIFNGFRALSANIAVEIPEAPHGGTLYRVLFLAALLLFLMTFIVNTAAEIVRMRLRKKFANL
jgi:phosphate transport system permease protein